MAEELTDAGDNRFEQERQTENEEDEEPLVFDGVTLSHSPRLGRRFIEWLSDRRE